MPLSINPIVKNIASASNILGSVSNSFNGGSSVGTGFAQEKASLEGLVGRLGGGIGSALNGATAGLSSGELGGVASALGGIGSAVQSAAGAISNVAGDIGRSINSAGLTGALGQVGQIAGAISSAAGQINNVLSVFRGKNLPSAGELFQSRQPVVELESGAADDWRVKINTNFGLFGGAFSQLAETGGVVWPYTPKITISSKANYTQIDPVHSNYPFFAYKSSQIDDITITGEFSCETEKDAAYWIAATTFFKTATKMFFGASSFVGNPPVICQLSGYGPGVFNKVPVIIKSFSVDMPDDTNYIKCNSTVGGPTWVPILSSISVTVAPIYNRTKLRSFSLQDYASGAGIAKGYI
jgi:hypothetical protein